MRHAGTRVASSCLGTALLLTPLAAAMCDTMLRAASSNCLGAAQVLAAPAAAMRLAGTRVAYGRLEASLLLTALAPTMRGAGTRVALS
jgi:hypothetical protein